MNSHDGRDREGERETELNQLNIFYSFVFLSVRKCSAEAMTIVKATTKWAFMKGKRK